MTNEPLIVRGLSKTYESDGASLHALRDVQLVVAPGEFVAVMGPSGCGKTTLLNIIAGLDDPTSGEVILAGSRMDELDERRRALVRRRQIGIVFQSYNLIGNLTAADNVELPALMAGLRPREVRQRRNDLFEALNLVGKEALAPSSLSGGEQQRVGLARALINRPAVLLADEPTGNLDSQSSREVAGILRGHSDEGQTILMVTHNPRIAGLADRIVIMNDGAISNEVTVDRDLDPRTVLSSLVSLEVSP